MNLRLLGFGIRRQPAAQLWRDTWPWLMGSLTVMLITGMLLFTSEATKLYYHEAFWVKMSSLLLAMLFTFTAMRKVALADPVRVGPVWGRAAALISILLWSTVGICGRWIGFS
jgi:NhaP-type Na+/H+ and K+/H+ antiporter